MSGGAPKEHHAGAKIMTDRLRLVQFVAESGRRAVGVPDADGKALRILDGVPSVYRLAMSAIEQGRPLAAVVDAVAPGASESYDKVAAEQRLLPPLDHADAAHCLVTGTGLTYRQSAKARDDMHVEGAASATPKTDSMRMYELGLDGGKPGPGKVGVQPEWFYKGDGSCIVASERPLEMPDFSLDGSEEPEIVGLYVIDGQGNPWRVGHALGNELSDHIMERQNYLYLAHSKLRRCSVGPELLVGPLPADLEGTSRVLRNGKPLWEATIRCGEANMNHALANLEHHHFKYTMFRRPGDVHVHYFGAAALSFAEGIRAQAGDIFEVAIPEFGRPLRNALAVARAPAPEVRSL
jgi:hypothetical protein